MKLNGRDTGPRLIVLQQGHRLWPNLTYEELLNSMAEIDLKQ
jgi:hypothetical protein